MTIALDSISANGPFDAATGTSYTHTPNSVPDGILIITPGGQTAGSGDLAGGVATYGGVSIPQITGSPIDVSGLAGACACFFKGSGIPGGPKTVAVSFTSGPTRCICYCIAFNNGGISVAINNKVVWNTTSCGVDPSQTLTLNSIVSLVLLGAMSGRNDVSLIAPKTGFTSRSELDLGLDTTFLYTYDTIAANDVDVGWLQATTDQAAGFGVAIMNAPVIGNPYYAYAQQ